MSQAPVRFSFAVHLHQPVGNFDFVFQEHLDEVYRPFLDAVRQHECAPITLHVSGTLLDWLEAHDAGFLDDLGRRIADGQIELMASGRSEPILAALEPSDRIEQIEAMREALCRRFGVKARGLWLTERVWEQDLAADLERAGIQYTLLDDRHFLAAGLERGELDRPFQTESGGHALTVLPIDERLRYLIPFRPVPEIEAFFRARHEEGTHAVVLGDDGEKFGGWPDTRAWVYEGGWLARFLCALGELRDSGIIELVAAEEVSGDTGGGLVYPTPGSYREMEEWTLPRPAAIRIETLWRQVEAMAGAIHDGADAASPAGYLPLVRGGHWKGFLRKYEEANRMHKAALHLSRLCRGRGDPPEARAAIGRAQCNDAYWHGIFGGIYLPHLRRAVWAELAAAEGSLRTDEHLGFDMLDWDFDGAPEIWVHSAAFSAVLSPERGGALEVLVRFGEAVNDVDVLTRRLEPYHAAPESSDDVSEMTPKDAHAPKSRTARGEGVASVHDRPLRRPIPPRLDPRPLALFFERCLRGDVEATVRGDARADSIGDGEATILCDWAGAAFALARAPDLQEGALHIELTGRSEGLELRKRLTFSESGEVAVELEWDPEAVPDAWLTTSLALARDSVIESDPAAREWRERIVTHTRSERGFEWIDQGELVTLAWPASLGKGVARLLPPGAPTQSG